jgi:hypothetical protein
MVDSEKRKYPRLPIGLDLSCRKVGSVAEKWHSGRTMNVSPGGLYFQTSTSAFKPGNLLNVELSIPPTTGLLEYGGRISGFARVLRADEIGSAKSEPARLRRVGLSSTRCGVAAEFCHPVRFCP